MMEYIEAGPAEAEDIALLHARSWQRHYRGLWPDEFLDHHVVKNRMEVWKDRFSKPDPHRRVLMVRETDVLIGFCCTFLDRDPVYGALLDNLHVDHPYQRQGIGQRLMSDAAHWVRSNRADSGIYLWVLEGNEGAIGLYEKMGGQRRERKEDDIPTGGKSWIYRYSWEDLEILFL